MSAPESKTCTSCGAAKPLSEYYFEKGRPRSKCKDCHKAKAYEVRADREAFNTKRRAYYAENSDAVSAAQRVRWAERAEVLNETRRAARAQDPERFRAQQRATYERNRDAIREQQHEYYLKNTDAWRVRWHHRRAITHGVHAERISRRAVFERDCGICGICGDPIEGAFHMDHIVPLALGGAHAWYNVQAAHPACNWRKKASLEGQVALPF